MNIGQQ
ncbi:hypothetical protein Aduo_006657 [Ancylostoma duodenale]